jgi:NAD(P)-dependent dehydrogenase (short-subunit alcohol dehydrogenase family)
VEQIICPVSYNRFHSLLPGSEPKSLFGPYALLLSFLFEVFIDLRSGKYIVKRHSHVIDEDPLLLGLAAGLFAVKPLRMADYAFVKRSFDVALFSAVELTRVLTSKKANADHLQGIVLISSVSALVGTKGYAVYGAVKASLLGWMKSLAVELAPRVRVNAVLPGGIRTKTTSFIYDMQEAPDPRYLLGEGRKTDVSDMVDFLLSDKSRWVTGQSFVVDGGLTIH